MPGGLQMAEADPLQFSEDRSPFGDRKGFPVPAGQEIAWIDLIPGDQWPLYKQAIQAVRRAGISFLVGGGFGLAAYTGRWRNTKDMDLYIVPGDRERTIQALTEEGFGDYYETLPYDPGWIYLST